MELIKHIKLMGECMRFSLAQLLFMEQNCIMDLIIMHTILVIVLMKLSFLDSIRIKLELITK